MPYQNPYASQPPYNPYLPQQYRQVQQQPVHGFVFVTGMEGAKAYQMPPNSEMPLFDDGGDVLYIKTTDGAGFPTITVADCIKRDSQPVMQADVPTIDDIAAVHAEINQLREAINGLVSTTAEQSEQRHLRTPE